MNDFLDEISKKERRIMLNRIKPLIQVYRNKAIKLALSCYLRGLLDRPIIEKEGEER